MVKNIFKMVKSRKLLTKLISYTLLLSLVPVLMASVFSYYNSKTAMDRNLTESNLRYIKQTVNAMEIVMDNIGDSCKRLALGTSFRDFENFYDGAYYENLLKKGSAREEQLPALYSYMQSKTEALEGISVLKLSSDFIHSVYFYDAKKNLVITSEGKLYSFEEFYDRDWFNLFDKEKLSPIFIDTRKTHQGNGQQKDLISVIYRSFNVEGNYFVINLDIDYIYRNILKKIDEKVENTIFVVSNDNNIIVNNHTNNLYQKIDQLPYMNGGLPEKSGASFSKNAGKSVLVVYDASDALGWKFVNVIDLESYYKGVNAIKVLIAVSLAVLILLIIPVVFLSSLRIYNPINGILQFIQKADGTIDHESFRGSLAEDTVISNSLKESFRERESLKQRLADSLPAYREKFILALMRNHSYSYDEIVQRIRYLDIRLEPENFILMLVSMEFPAEDLDLESVQMDKLLIMELLQNSAAGKNLVTVEMEENKYLILVNCDGGELDAMFLRAKDLKHRIREEFNTTCTIAISNHYKNIFDLRKAFKEAEEALKYRIVTGPDQVIFIEDMRLNHVNKLDYPKEKEITLNNYIKNGDGENAVKVFREFLKDIAVQKGNIEYQEAQQIYVQLLGSMINTASSAGLEIKDVFGEGTNPYSELMEKELFGDILHFFEKTIEVITSNIRSAYKDKNNRYIEQIKRMISEDCGYNISVNAVASKLKLNPDYVSRIFKESTGKNFTEYLTTIRLETAKKMLTDTDLKVKDICEKIGYSNSYYFIKLFKEFTGITPGEYKKKNAGGSLD